MTNPRPTRDTMYIEEATLFKMWEIAAILLAPRCSPDLRLGFARKHLRPWLSRRRGVPTEGPGTRTVHSLFTL
jgi:hypothetical protein